jgi:hypothetical protein
MRPPFILEDVSGIELRFVDTQHAQDVPILALKDVQDLRTFQCRSVADTVIEKADRKDIYH